MSELDAELREFVAAEHGLPERAVMFLDGPTVDEVETQAAMLARLLGASGAGEPERTQPLADLFANTGAEKARRQRALVEALHGRPGRQPRDERGRYAASSSGFDGGARTPVPVPRSPEEQHNETILQLAWLSRVYGARF